MTNKNQIIIYSNSLYRGLYFYDKTRKFDKNRLDIVSGFYGTGIYFTQSIAEAGIWGTFIVEYVPVKKLKLYAINQSFIKTIKRSDYLSKAPDDCDGIILGNGAEGGSQIILKDSSLVEYKIVVNKNYL